MSSGAIVLSGNCPIRQLSDGAIVAGVIVPGAMVREPIQRKYKY